MFDAAEIRHGEMVIQPYRGPGPSKLARTKQLIAMRLHADLLDRPRAPGPGWQRRLNDAVRAWMDSPPT